MVKAWKGDIANILPRFRHHMEIRKVYGVDGPHFCKLVLYSHHYRIFQAMSKVYGFAQFRDVADKNGNILIVFRFGGIDVGEVQRRISCRDYLWFQLVFWGDVAKTYCRNGAGKKLKTPLAITFVQELAGVHLGSFLRHGMSGPAKQAFWVVAYTQPELISKFFIANCPKSVDIFFKFVKPMLPPETFKKFTTVGGGDFAELVNHAGAENHPAEYGGMANYKVLNCDTDLLKMSHLYPDVDRPSDMKTVHLRPKQAFQCPIGTAQMSWFLETNSSYSSAS